MYERVVHLDDQELSMKESLPFSREQLSTFMTCKRVDHLDDIV